MSSAVMSGSLTHLPRSICKCIHNLLANAPSRLVLEHHVSGRAVGVAATRRPHRNFLARLQDVLGGKLVVELLSTVNLTFEQPATEGLILKR